MGHRINFVQHQVCDYRKMVRVTCFLRDGVVIVFGQVGSPRDMQLRCINVATISMITRCLAKVPCNFRRGSFFFSDIFPPVRSCRGIQ